MDLSEAPDFEAAAAIILDGIERATSNALQHTKPTTKVLRASVHVFARDGWRDIAAAEWHPSPDEASRHSELRRSSTLWRLIDDNRSPVSVNTLTKSGVVYSTSEDIEARELDDVDPSSTLLRGNATHAVGLPMMLRGKELVGMVTIELHCASAVARFPAPNCIPELVGLVQQYAEDLINKPTRTILRDAKDKKLDRHRDVSELVRRFASLRDHVIIKGPTGTGKTYLARQIHEASDRTGAFVVFSGNAFPRDYELSHLVGFVGKGTNPTIQGAIDAAQGGTLFIDEVDKLWHETQVALLSLTDSVKDPMYSPIGGKPRPVGDVRFIFASNANLRKAVEARTFLPDLLFRINRLPITLRPLSERKDEIPYWCEFFVQEIHQERRASGKCVLTPNAIALLRRQEWPGNLRDLRSTIGIAHTFTDGIENAFVIDESRILEALDFDTESSDRTLEADFEALARAIVRETQRALKDSGRQDVDDDENPGLANLFRKEPYLFHSIIWMMAEELSDANATQIDVARLVGKARAVGPNNYAKDVKAAMRKVSDLYRYFGKPLPEKAQALLDGKTFRRRGVQERG